MACFIGSPFFPPVWKKKGLEVVRLEGMITNHTVHTESVKYK